MPGQPLPGPLFFRRVAGRRQRQQVAIVSRERFLERRLGCSERRPAVGAAGAFRRRSIAQLLEQVPPTVDVRGELGESVGLAQPAISSSAAKNARSWSAKIPRTSRASMRSHGTRAATVARQ